MLDFPKKKPVSGPPIAPPPMKPPSKVLSTTVALLAIDDVEIEKLKEKLRERCLSVATPGLSGSKRVQALQERLADDIKREAKEKAEAKKMSSATRTAAFRAFRLDQASKRLEAAMYRTDADGMLNAIKVGADPNRVCKSGLIPLHNAVECGDIELAVLLIRSGADVNMKSTYYSNPFIEGLSMQSSSMMLDAGSSMETVSSLPPPSASGSTPLMIACLHNLPRTVAALLELKANPNICCDVFQYRDLAPLAVAVARNRADIARSLLDAGAVKHWMDDRGRSPLMYAARCGAAACVKLLLQRGADPNAIDFDARTALDWATMALKEVIAYEKGDDGESGSVNSRQSWADSPREPIASLDDLQAVIRLLTAQTYRTRPVSAKREEWEDALQAFAVGTLIEIPTPKRDTAGLKVSSINQSVATSVPMQGSSIISPQPSSVLSADGDDIVLGLTDVKLPSQKLCEQCLVTPAKIRCLNCCQLQCERCCVAQHAQDGRRHHTIKPLRSLFTPEAQQMIALTHQPPTSLGHSVGLARQTMDRIRSVIEESPMGAISLLREMEARIAKEDNAIEVEDAAAGLAGSAAIISKYGSMESDNGSTVAVGRRYRRSSMSTQFQNKNKGLELFPVVPAGRRKSDALMAKEIAVLRAKEKIRMLFQSAPELDLAEFYLKHDKFPDAEATLLKFLDDMKGKVPPGDDIWFKTNCLLIKLRAKQELWGAAVAVGFETLHTLSDDEDFARPDVVACVFDVGSALAQLGDLHQATELYKSSYMRLMQCDDEDSDEVKAAIATYMDKFDVTHSEWECQLMRKEDERELSKMPPEVKSDAVPKVIEPTQTELFNVLLAPRWVKSLRKLCKRDGTLSSVNFLMAVREFRTLAKESLPSAAAEIVRKFITNPSIIPVLPMVIKNRLRASLRTATTITSFDECEKVVIDSVVRGALTRFLQSETGKKYARYRRRLDKYEKVDASQLAKRKVAEVTDGVHHGDGENGELIDATSGAYVDEGDGGAGAGYDSEWASGDETGDAADVTQGLDYSTEEYHAMSVAIDKYLKRYDATSGHPYFVDVESGESSWDVPAPFHHEWEVPYRVICVQCDATFATRECMECEHGYCDGCFVQSHAKGERRAHRYVPLTAHDPVCCTCYVRFGMRQCLQCALSYCTSCLIQVHAGYGLAGHTWTSVEFAVDESIGQDLEEETGAPAAEYDTTAFNFAAESLDAGVDPYEYQYASTAEQEY